MCSWQLTDKGKEFIRNYRTKEDDTKCLNNLDKDDGLFKTLINIEGKNMKSIEAHLLEKCEEENYIKKSDLNSLIVTKGEELADESHLSCDLTVDMITSESWNKVVLSSYNYDKKGNIGKFGSFHVVYSFITAVRHALFELGFREVAIPSYVEKYSFINYVMETLQDEHDCIFSVNFRENTDLAGKENLDEKAGLTNKYYLRNNLFHGLLSEIPSIKSVPSKLFTIGKVFQNKEFDTFDIPEFHALEIMVSDSDLDLSNVIGICFGLFSRLNLVYTDFKQAYFPYTSPTVGIYLYNEILDAWVSVGEGGIIRPELAKKLGYNESMSILRLGFSLERILMNKRETDDISQLLWLQEK